MNSFALLGIVLVISGILVIYSIIKGSGKAGMVKLDAELLQVARSDKGKFLYTEYAVMYNGERIEVQCPNKTKTEIGGRETMYYDIAKNVLISEKSRRLNIVIGAVTIVLGILAIYFHAQLSVIFGR